MVFFNDDAFAPSSEEDSLAASEADADAEQSQSRIGLPMQTVELPSLRSLYWRRPGRQHDGEAGVTAVASDFSSLLAGPDAA